MTHSCRGRRLRLRRSFRCAKFNQRCCLVQHVQAKPPIIRLLASAPLRLVALLRRHLSGLPRHQSQDHDLHRSAQPSVAPRHPTRGSALAPQPQNLVVGR